MNWSEMTTPERVTALGNLIAASPTASATELGVTLGASRNAVLGFIARNEIKLPEWTGQPKADPWTPEATEALRAAYSSGRLLAEIAAELGVTRDAAIGKANRMGLSHPHPRTAPRRSHGLKFGAPVSDVPLLPADVDAKAFLPLPGSTPKTLTDLAVLRHDGTSTECHWPVGDGPIMFCGCATDGASRYCAVHTKRSGKMVPRLVLA